MIDVRGGIFTLLDTLSVDCYHTRIDPFKADKYPVLSVQYNNVDRSQIGDNFTFRVIAGVSVIVSVATTASNFDSTLDTLVNDVLSKLLTDPVWNTQFEQVKNINTKYGYVKAGDTDLATAYITFDCVFVEIYDPAITADWIRTHIDIDFVSPFDPNTGATGPDGKIEATYDFEQDDILDEPILEDPDELEENNDGQ
jgi:hypothetical protein